MDYSIWILQKYGLSINNIKTLSEQIISIFDLIITEKREDRLRSTNRKYAINKALDVIEKNPELIRLNFMESPYILLGFNAPFRALDLLIKNHNIEEVDLLDSMSIEELDEKMFPSMRKTIVKIKQSADKFYSAGQFESKYLKTIILNNLFREKKVSIKSLTDTTILLPEKFYNKFDISIEDMFTILNELEIDGYIYTYGNNYYFPTNIFYTSEYERISKDRVIKPKKQLKAITLSDYLETNFKDKDIIIQRLNGKTLEEIGKKYNVSRERIRQRQMVVLKKAPEIYEINKYKDIFEEYSFSKNEFTIMFNVDSKVYELLMLVLKKGKKDTGEYILKSDKILGSKKEKYLEKHKYYLTRFGEFKRINKQEFFEEILYKYKERSFDSDVFLEIYNAEAKKYPHLNLEVNNLRSLEGIATRSLFTISTLGRAFRYFDMSPTADDDLLKDLINNLDDGCYSMNKIMNENKVIINHLDIQDEYELHNFYKKRADLLDSNINITRSPEFTVGDINKKDFIKEFIIEFSEQPVNSLVDYLYDEYGFRKNTMLSYITSNFKEYVNKDRIVYVSDDSHQNVEIDLASIIYEPVYLKSEVVKQLKTIDLKLNTVMLSRLGYYMTGNIIFKKKFGNVSRALSSIIGSEDIWRRGTSPLEQSNEMTMHLSSLERKRKFVVLDENIYAKTSFLDRSGIGIDLLESYIKSIYHFLPEKHYFSLQSLELNNFKHTLIDFGFEPIFYERLISTSDLFNPVNRNSPVLFAKGVETPVTLSKFFRSELESNSNGIDIYDLKDSIKEKYKIEFDIYTIQYRSQQSGAYYSQQMEKLYINKEKYLDEVYS